MRCRFFITITFGHESGFKDRISQYLLTAFSVCLACLCQRAGTDLQTPLLEKSDDALTAHVPRLRNSSIWATVLLFLCRLLNLFGRRLFQSCSQVRSG